MNDAVAELLHALAFEGKSVVIKEDERNVVVPDELLDFFECIVQASVALDSSPDHVLRAECAFKRASARRKESCEISVA